MSLATAFEAGEIVRELRKSGLPQVAIAEATGADERSVRNWEQTRNISREYENRVRALREIVLVLDDSLSPSGIRQWLYAKNRHLKGARPVDVLQRGEGDRVLRVAQSFVEGSYI